MRNIDPAVPAGAPDQVYYEFRGKSVCVGLCILKRTVVLVPVGQVITVRVAQIHEPDRAELLHELLEGVSDDLLQQVLVCFEEDSNVVYGVRRVSLQKLYIDTVVEDGRRHDVE